MPRLFYFNPTAEMAIQNSHPSYQPPAVLQMFEANLSCLPFVFCGTSDAVVVSAKPTAELQQLWQRAGLPNPRFIQYSELSDNKSEYYDLTPWANSPNLRVVFPKFNQHEKLGFDNLSIPIWDPVLSVLLRRETSFALWDKLIVAGLAHQYQKPAFCTSIDEVKSALRHNQKSVVKLNFTSSGRGLFFVDSSLSIDDERRINNAIKHGATVEPYYSTIADISLQFEFDSGAVQFLGISQICNGKHGRYEGSVVHPISVLWNGQAVDLVSLTQPIVSFYERELGSSVYCENGTGVLGIDLLVYANPELNVLPLVEVNARYTMGLLALRLASYVHDTSQAMFYIKHCKTGAEDFCSEMMRTSPLQMKFDKIESGFVPLSNYEDNARFVAYMTVAKVSEDR